MQSLSRVNVDCLAMIDSLKTDTILSHFLKAGWAWLSNSW